MKELLHKFSILMLFLYITSVYVFSYNKELYMISNIIFVVLAGISVLYVMLRGSLIVPKAMYALFFFYMIMVASYFWIIEDMNATRWNLTMILMIGIVGIITNLIIEEKHIDLIIKIIYFAGLIMCLYSLAIYGFQATIESLGSETTVRLGKEINQENVFGSVCALTAVIGIYFAFYEKKGIYYIISLLPVVYAFASGSRKAILIISLSLIILIIAKKGKSRTTTFLISLISIVILVVIFNYLKSLDLFVFERFETFLNIFGDEKSKADASATMRMKMIKQGIEWFLKRPILGYGIDQYSVMFYRDYGIKTYSHSTVIEILVNFGVVGFVAYYSLYVYMFVYIVRGLKRKIPYSIIIFLIFGVMMISNIFSVELYSKQAYILTAINLSYVNINKNKLKKQPEEIPEEAPDCEVKV